MKLKANRVCNQTKRDDQSFLSHSNTKQTLAHSSLNCIWIQREKKWNISNKNKGYTHVCLCVHASILSYKPVTHMENAPVRTPIPQKKDYITHLSLRLHPSQVWRSSERPLLRRHWSWLVLNYGSCAFPFSAHQLNSGKMDCSAKTIYTHLNRSHFNTLRQKQ